jgi:hypothetical protein
MYIPVSALEEGVLLSLYFRILSYIYPFIRIKMLIRKSLRPRDEEYFE